MKRGLFILLLAIVMLGSGCTDSYYQDTGSSRPPYGHSGGAYHAPEEYSLSRYQLIENCERKVENKVERRLGHGVRLRYDRPAVYFDSRTRATIEGEVTASASNYRQELGYRCRINRNSGYVDSIKLDWYGQKPPANNEQRNKKAKRSCKDAIRHKLAKDIHRAHSVDFKTGQVQQNSKKYLDVTGTARIHVKQGAGRIAYDCRFSLNPLTRQSANYHWTQPLPGTSKPDLNARSKQLCHAALRKRLQHSGYSNIQILSSSVHPLQHNRRLVEMRVRTKRDGSTSIRHWECRVNAKRQRILELKEK